MTKTKWSTMFVITMAFIAFLMGWRHGENVAKQMNKVECDK